ncbi:MAG: ABC transporter permease [Eubacteriales bacterium]
MKSIITFTMKEIVESVKTFKFIIIGFVFVFFGVSSPIMAKYLPQIIGTFDANLAGVIPEPQIMDAYAQFFKNIGQIAFIIMIIIFSGIVAQEKNKGTLVMILSKKINRSIIIISKFAASAIIFSMCYLLAGIICWIYGSYLFPGEELHHIILAMGSMWLFGMLTVSISIFFSTLLKNSSMAAMGSFVTWILITLIGSIPKISAYAPTVFSSKNLLMIQGMIELKDLIIPVIIVLIMIMGLLLISIYNFQRQEI